MVVYRRGNRRSILILLVITSIALITLDVRNAGPVVGAKGVARDVFEPVGSAAGRVFSPVGDWVTGITGAGSLREENDRLRRELEEAGGGEASASALESENQELSRLLDLPYVEDADAIAARIVAGSPSNFEWTVQINRGSNDGVSTDMAVVAAQGLVGKVVEVSRNHATVRLVTDPNSGVEVVTEAAAGEDGEPTRTTGIVRGRTGQNRLRLTGVDPAAPVEEGSYVYTSGRTTSLFPPNIPVGEVVKVEKRSGDLEQDILVEPIVAFDNVEFVKVLPPPAAPVE